MLEQQIVDYNAEADNGTRIKVGYTMVKDKCLLIN